MFKFFIVKNDYKATSSLYTNLHNSLLKKGYCEDEINPEFVFVVGGDGTFLKAVHKYQEKLDKIKFVPFKSGGIGFYTNRNEIEFLEKILLALNKNEMQVSNYELLELQNGNKIHYICNELKILNEKSLVYIKIFINDEYLETFHGTGVVVSTANGSTGYMKSTGGAVILPKNAGIYEFQELVPVSTNKYRTLNAPLILNKNLILRFELETTDDILICDTQVRKIKDKILKIKVSDKNVTILSLKKLKPQSEIKFLREIFIKDKEVIE